MSKGENKEAAVKEEEKNASFKPMETKAYNDMVIEVEGTKGRKYKYTMPFNAPLTECHMAGINVLMKIKEIYDDVVAKHKETKKDEGEKEVAE